MFLSCFPPPRPISERVCLKSTRGAAVSFIRCSLPMLAYMVRPVGDGPFPLLVMNHGVSLDPKERSFFPVIEFRDAALWFARQGYVVVAPVRPGYGATAIEIPERGLFGLFFSGVGNCSDANFRDAGLAIASLNMWVIDYMSNQPFIKRDDAVVVGQSGGGWGAIALARQNPTSVRAIIGFEAGRGGHYNGKPNNNCAPDGMITQVAFGCGPFRTRVGGVCVARTTIRHVRREVRRCALWHGGVCARWVY
jgi:dienelactone hydrolase